MKLLILSLLFLQDTKLWIIMEYLGGGSALDLVSKLVMNYINLVNLVKISLMHFLNISAVYNSPEILV